MPAPQLVVAMLSQNRKGKRRVIKTMPEKVEPSLKKANLRGFPSSSPIPTPAKASSKLSLQLEDIKVTYEEGAGLIGGFEVSVEVGSKRSVRGVEGIEVVEGGGYLKGEWDEKAEENLVPFGTVFEGASKEMLALANVFLLRLVTNLTDMKSAKIIGLLIGTDNISKSAEEGM